MQGLVRDKPELTFAKLLQILQEAYARQQSILKSGTHDHQAGARDASLSPAEAKQRTKNLNDAFIPGATAEIRQNAQVAEDDALILSKLCARDAHIPVFKSWTLNSSGTPAPVIKIMNGFARPADLEVSAFLSLSLSYRFR